MRTGSVDAVRTQPGLEQRTFRQKPKTGAPRSARPKPSKGLRVSDLCSGVV